MEIREALQDGSVTSPVGFVAAATACGLKASGRLDLMLVYSGHDCATAAVFTQNQVVGAPVIVNRETLASNRTAIRGIVANAGIANACTGGLGLSNARAMRQLAAEALGCRSEQILVLSTGVIGVQLPMDKVQAGIEAAAGALAPENGRFAAEAFMTTDTRPKHLAVQVELPGGAVTIGGMAKGSGMIHPNMATMLAVITTDAAVSPDLLQSLLQAAVNRSFNRISVDGDTSTSDTVFLLANGASGVAIADDEAITIFGRGLNHVCTELAKLIVRDGEGASKFVTIHVSGARTEADAHAIAQTIATSPLVKTAFAGSDPNWGR
ncbi:MAG TPA: bifunctional glutamate N-acetyltransferase/amino-acid acetyltransferase ArgJ, partial [Anaerolineae bacterium]